MFETIFSRNSLGRALSQMDPFVNLCPPNGTYGMAPGAYASKTTTLAHASSATWNTLRVVLAASRGVVPGPFSVPVAAVARDIEWAPSERSMIKVWKFISIVIEIKRLVLNMLCSSCCFWSIKKQLAMTSASIGNPPKAVSAFWRRSSLTGLGVCFVHMSVGTWFNLCIPPASLPLKSEATANLTKNKNTS